MANTEAVNIHVTSSGETTSSLIEKLGAAYAELEALKVTSTCDVQWNDVQEHLSHLESMVKNKLKELEAKKKTFSERESHNRELIAAREAEVLSMEQDMQDQVQELKDAAVATIEEARETHVPETLEPANGGDTDGNQVNSSMENENAHLDAEEGKSPSHEDNAEDLAAEGNPNVELTQFGEQMDS